MLDQITLITGVAARHWQPFDVTTPAGHQMVGYLCCQESERLGTLALTMMDGHPRLDFIPAMPKLHYPYQPDDAGQPMLAIPLSPAVQDARFTRKLDGTAIIFYGLTDVTGEVVEVIPRTRLQPVLIKSHWGDWVRMLDEALPDRAAVETAVRREGVVLVFELWGQGNPHLVRYQERLHLTLHTAVAAGGVLPFPRLAALAAHHGLTLVPTLEMASLDADELAHSYRRWQTEIEVQNQAAGDGVYVEEGAILVLSTAETATGFKCKPPSIEEVHWTLDRHLSGALIRQALLKMRENGYDIETADVEAVERFLAADYPTHEIEQAHKLIERHWTAYQEEVRREVQLRAQVEAAGIPPTDLPALLRHLSQHYDRREMTWVYVTLKTLFGAG